MEDLSTTNVIECQDNERMGIVQLKSFPDSPEGNKAAEELFTQLVIKRKPESDDIDIANYLEEGYCEVGAGSIVLVHSSKTGAYR